jgi:hypothetical protein
VRFEQVVIQRAQADGHWALAAGVRCRPIASAVSKFRKDDEKVERVREQADFVIDLQRQIDNLGAESSSTVLDQVKRFWEDDWVMVLDMVKYPAFLRSERRDLYNAIRTELIDAGMIVEQKWSFPRPIDTNLPIVRLILADDLEAFRSIWRPDMVLSDFIPFVPGCAWPSTVSALSACACFRARRCDQFLIASGAEVTAPNEDTAVKRCPMQFAVAGATQGSSHCLSLAVRASGTACRSRSATTKRASSTGS